MDGFSLEWRYAICAACLCTAFSVRAQTLIPITNPDFETGGRVSDGFSSPGVIPSGWSGVGGPGGAFYGYYNPDNSAYTGTAGNFAIGTMAGPNTFYFGSAGDGQGIEQTLSTPFAADTSYTLTLAVGERKDGFMASVQMDLFAGASLLATTTVHNPTADTFADFSLTYNANPANNGLAGQALRIRFLEIDNRGPNGFEVDIDNVRLTSVPEPSTYTVIFGSGLALAFALRRAFRS